jgi:hypothetical protein
MAAAGSRLREDSYRCRADAMTVRPPQNVRNKTVME